MIDPNVGLVSYQAALLRGEIRPIACEIHKELTVLFDNAPAGIRITYALTKGKVVKALVMYAPNGTNEGKPYFQVGYAVAEQFRGAGIAKRALKLSVEEFSEGFRSSVPAFYIEAVVSPSNIASINVAEAVIGGTPEEITDQHSGQRALRFTMSVGV